MELVQGTRKASNFAPQDFISNMPENVITNILDRLPLQDAVRTDVLSKNWRFKWTMLSQLVLDDDFFEYLLETEDETNHVRIVSRLLLHLRGPITKFVISLDDHGYSKMDVEDINHWFAFLSRNGIKDITFMSSVLVNLPTHLFSCLGLKHLKLINCRIRPPTTFHGFPNLLSLELRLSTLESWKFGKFLMLCPALEILKTSDPCSIVKLDDIAKLANLKILSLNLGNLEHMTITDSGDIFKLLGFLPRLQELELVFPWCKFTEGGAKKRFPDAFPCLKALKLSSIDVGSVFMISCVFEMIRHLPNLQTLEIIATSSLDADFPLEVDYNTIGPLQLRSATFINLKGLENEVCLIKYLLACSPFLKRIVISHEHLARHEQSLFATKLLKLQRSYPGVDISLC